MSKPRLPGLVIETADLPEFLRKPEEEILAKIREVLLHRSYVAQRAVLAKCDDVEFAPTRDSCVFTRKGRPLLHVRFVALKTG
jgi:hypothetical protein